MALASAMIALLVESAGAGDSGVMMSSSTLMLLLFDGDLFFLYFIRRKL